MAAPGLLAVWMDTPLALEEEFNAWYNEEHVPERVALPGFLTARRYAIVEPPLAAGAQPRSGQPWWRGSPYMAHYDLRDLQVLHSEPYDGISGHPTPWTRRIISKLAQNVRNEYELVQSIGQAPAEPAPYALLVRIETDAEHDAELNDWYERDHLPALQAVPGCFRARRFRAAVGSPRYLAMYEFATAEVSSSAAWRAAANSEWTLKMRPKFRNLTGDLGELILARG